MTSEYEGKSTGVCLLLAHSSDTPAEVVELIMIIAPPNIIQDPIQMLANAQQLSALSELICPMHLSQCAETPNKAPM